jgi:hypothetical protein
MTDDTLEVRPMAHPKNKWGVFDVDRNKFIASYVDELSAYRFAFGYLNEEIAWMARQAATREENGHALVKHDAESL